jgi:hypothetical protein
MSSIYTILRGYNRIRPVAGVSLSGSLNLYLFLSVHVSPEFTCIYSIYFHEPIFCRRYQSHERGH